MNNPQNRLFLLVVVVFVLVLVVSAAAAVVAVGAWHRDQVFAARKATEIQVREDLEILLRQEDRDRKARLIVTAVSLPRRLGISDVDAIDVAFAELDVDGTDLAAARAGKLGHEAATSVAAYDLAHQVAWEEGVRRLKEVPATRSLWATLFGPPSPKAK